MIVAQPVNASTAAGAILSFAFSLIMHVILLTAMILAALMLVRITLMLGPHKPPSSIQSSHHDIAIEGLLRTTALATGFLLVFAVKATGTSVSDILANSVSLASPYQFAAIGVVPAAAGVLVAWYFLRALRKDSQVGLRILLFIGAATLGLFIDVYAAAVGSAGFGLAPAIIPNVVFIAALGIYAFTRYQHQ